MAPPHHSIGEGDVAKPIHAPKVPAFGKRVYTKHAPCTAERVNRGGRAVHKASTVAYALL